MNASALYQGLVNDMLHDMVSRFMYIYLDDILIFSETLEENIQHVHKVIQHQLYLKAENCEFHRFSVQFLGFIVSGGQLGMDPH